MSARERLEQLVSAQAAERVTPPFLLPASPYFDLAGEEFGRRLLLTAGNDGADYCLRPDFTLPIVTGYLAGEAGVPAAFTYLGPVFRQREDGPHEFDQAGLELLGRTDAEEALDEVVRFARSALAIYGIDRPSVLLGGIGLFEALLAKLEMPDAWRPRIRDRFGHSEAMARLLDRLEAAPETPRRERPDRAALVEEITAAMLAAGLSLTEARRPEEIADRFIEQQALDAAHVPLETIVLLREYLAISGEVRPSLALVDQFARVVGIDLSQEIATIERHLREFEGAAISFDAGFSPRLDYYTGIVFEMRGQGGDVLASGGQYDRLLERLGAGHRIAAVGCALWVDRLDAEATR